MAQPLPPFVPTTDWQEVPLGAVVPEGVETRMDTRMGEETGVFARIPPRKARTKAEERFEDFVRPPIRAVERPVEGEPAVEAAIPPETEEVAPEVPTERATTLPMLPVTPAAPEAPKAPSVGELGVAAAEAEPEPTEGQREAGNQHKGHINAGDLDITIETAMGAEEKFPDLFFPTRGKMRLRGQVYQSYWTGS